MTLRENILYWLGRSPIPVATPDLILLCAFGKSHARGRVWDELVKLERKGLVARAGKGKSRVDTGGGANQRVTLWRLK